MQDDTLPEVKLPQEGTAEFEEVKRRALGTPVSELSDEELSDQKLINFSTDTEIWTSKQLLATEFPEPQWIIEGLIPEGLTLLCGKPKTGKSWLALQMATAASVGLDALGHFRTNAGSEGIGVVYLALEDTPRRLRSRIDKLRSLGTDNCKFITGHSTNMPGVKSLAKYLDENPGTKLIVIDTLAQFLPSFDFNSYSETYPVMSSLKQISDKHGAAIVAIHHTRKSGGDDFLDAVTGSNAFTGVADTTMVLTRGRGKAQGSIVATGRDIDEIDFAMTLERDLGWRYLGGEEFRMSEERKEVYDLLKEAKEALSPTDVAEILKKDRGNIKVMLYRMYNEGQIDKAGHGRYKVE